MIIKQFHSIRRDGVILHVSMDVAVDENGNPIKDENGKYVPSGFQIRKSGTNELYNQAVDVESATFSYEETGIPVVVRKKRRSEG